MTNILSENDSRRTIALQYLTRSAFDMERAKGDMFAAIAAIRVVKHYVELGRQYGCTDREMRLALGVSENKWESLR